MYGRTSETERAPNSAEGSAALIRSHQKSSMGLTLFSGGIRMDPVTTTSRDPPREATTIASVDGAAPPPSPLLGWIGNRTVP
jgi:hypothetical protein